MTDRMSGAYVRDQLVTALTRLALPAIEQARYLDRLGTGPSTDELALELGDFIPMLSVAVGDGALSQSQALAIKSVSDYVRSFSGPNRADLWEATQLYTAPEWEDVRKLASTALRLLTS